MPDGSWVGAQSLAIVGRRRVCGSARGGAGERRAGVTGPLGGDAHPHSTSTLPLQTAWQVLGVMAPGMGPACADPYPCTSATYSCAEPCRRAGLPCGTGTAFWECAAAC